MTRKEYRDELKKLKKMNQKDKCWYIWEYYKIPVLIFAVVLFLLFQAGGALYRSGEDCMLYCVFLELPSATEQKTKQLQDDFYETMNFSDRETVTFDTSLSLSDPAYRDASVIILQSLLGTGTADVVVTTPELLNDYCGQDAFLNLSKVLPAELFTDFSSDLIYAENSSGQSIPAGIRLKESILPSVYGVDEDAVLAVCTLENHPEVIIDFLYFIFS